MTAIRLLTIDDLPAAYPLMAQLRPHLSEERFIGLCRTQFAEGFLLAGLVTDGDSRSAGHGAALIEWLKTHGRERGCALLSLDSGVQRHGAHRFYLRERFDIAAHHFTQAL